MTSTIFVKSLIIKGIHGAHPESALPKDFKIDMEISVRTITEAVATDDISYVYDYRQAVRSAKKIIEGPSVHLIETLASKIIEEVFKNKKVQKIKLTLTKREFGDEFDSGITVIL